MTSPEVRVSSRSSATMLRWMTFTASETRAKSAGSAASSWARLR